jgi:LPXTG-motif cell wall-anchored protein
LDTTLSRALLLGAAMAWGIASPVAAVEDTQVLVTGPRNWHPDPGYVLVMQGKVWTVNAQGGGGLATVHAERPFVVTVRRLDTCAVVVRFTAQAGHVYGVVFRDDGSASEADIGGADGPGWSPSGRVDCSTMPDTTRVVPISETGDQSPSLASYVAASVGLATGALFLRRRRRIAGG